MFSVAMILHLRPGSLNAYREAHDRLWPQIAQSMSDNRVSMIIFHNHGELFVFATAPSEAHWERSREAPALAEWNKKITEFVRATPAGEIAFEFPDRVFTFGTYAALPNAPNSSSEIAK
jgi:L-rhamnose mutarotase